MVFHAIDLDRLSDKIDAPQQRAALHAEIRVAVDERALGLEQHHGNGLVHARGAGQICRGILARLRQLWPEAGDIGIAVHLLGKLRERAQADAVAVL